MPKKVKLVNKKVNPAIFPLPSIGVESPKKAKHEGIPMPKEVPSKLLVKRRLEGIVTSSRSGSTELSAPKIIQNLRRV